MQTYPTLTIIDQALGADGPGFATSVHATPLESFARSLADEYWSETVWLTGRISEAAFRRVYEPLALRRLALERVAWQDARTGTEQTLASTVVAA